MSKFRSISGIACKTRSRTPPRSAKVKLSKRRSEESFREILRRQPDHDLKRALLQATRVEASLKQMEQHFSHRCEPDQIVVTRAKLERVRNYIHAAMLECAARNIGLPSQREGEGAVCA